MRDRMATGDAGPRSSDPPAPGLRFSEDAERGIRRLKRGRGFSYLRHDGEPVRDVATLERIRALVIPPAWSDVWICASPSGHLQATGRDARGRKVYRYHPRYRRHRESSKYRRLVAFGRLALVVRLLELTHMRVGNEQYVSANRTFGLTTLRRRHAQVGASSIRFHFTGKSGKVHELRLSDRRLARMVHRCQELPGQALFGYVDEDGATREIHSDDVNDYLRRISGGDVTARDFRTWAGTVLALRELRRQGAPGSGPIQHQQVASAVDSVATRLGNTRAVARNSYVHPAVIEAWRSGSLPPGRVTPDPSRPPTPAEERAVISVLDVALARESVGT